MSAQLHIAQSATPLIGERELTRRRILRALEARRRYRYVKPMVITTEDGWLVTSPCCSRNVDPDGGVIDIARILAGDEGWSLLVRNEARDGWRVHSVAARLDALLRVLCEDEERQFWP